MYVFTNLKTQIKNFDVFEVNGKKQIKTKVDNMTITGKEKDMNCNIYVVEGTSTDTVINIDKIYPAKVIECEIEYETDIVQEEFSVSDLVKSFGSKRNIERLNGVEVDGYLKKPSVVSGNKTQILPMMSGSVDKFDGVRDVNRFDKRLEGSVENGVIRDVNRNISSSIDKRVDGSDKRVDGINNDNTNNDNTNYNIDNDNTDITNNHSHSHNTHTNTQNKFINLFTLEDLFKINTLNEFNKIQKFDLCNETKRFYNGQNNKLRILLLDCLIRLLSFKYVTKDVFDDSPYKSFSSEFIEDIEVRKLSKLSRDRFIIKVYILILQIEGGQVILSSVPSFNMSVEAVLSYFQVLGCIYNKNTNEIKMVTRPMEYTRK